MVKVYSFSPYSRVVAFQNHFQNDTHYTIKCQILSLSRCISLRTKLPTTAWWATFQFSCQQFFIFQVLNFINCWYNIILNTRTFQAPCIIFLKTKAGLICIWRTLQNVGLCSITGERQLKLELDENIFVKPCPSKLTWKLSLNSLIQLLTMFYFDHVYELNSTLLGLGTLLRLWTLLELGTLFLLIIRNSLTMLLLQTICLILSLC